MTVSLTDHQVGLWFAVKLSSCSTYYGDRGTNSIPFYYTQNTATKLTFSQTHEYLEFCGLWEPREICQPWKRDHYPATCRCLVLNPGRRGEKWDIPLSYPVFGADLWLSAKGKYDRLYNKSTLKLVLFLKCSWMLHKSWYCKSCIYWPWSTNFSSMFPMIGILVFL